MMVDLEGIRGDTEEYNMRLLNENREPMDITGVEIWFTVKSDLDADDSSAVIQKSTAAGIIITDAPGGIAKVTIDPTDWDDVPVDGETSIYYWDAQIVNGSRVTTVGRGRFLVMADVTRSIV